MVLQHPNGFNTLFTNDKPVLNNGPKILSKNLPDCSIFCNWVFNNFLLAETYLENLYEVLKLIN